MAFVLKKIARKIRAAGKTPGESGGKGGGGIAGMGDRRGGGVGDDGGGGGDGVEEKSHLFRE